MKVAEILGVMQLKDRQFYQKFGALRFVAPVEQRENRLMQERRHPHHEFGIEALVAGLALQPGEVEIQRAHFDVGEHVDGVFEAGGDPDRAVGRHQPAPLRRRDLHRSPGGVDQLRLAVHVGVEPNALLVAARHQMDAVAGRDMTCSDGGDWRFGDIHWRHPVRASTYNLFQ